VTFATKRDFAEALTKTSLGLPGASAAGSRGPGGSPTPGSPPGSPRLLAARRSTRPRPVGAVVADEEVRRLAHPPPSAQERHLRMRSTTTGKAVGERALRLVLPPAVGLTTVELWLQLANSLGPQPQVELCPPTHILASRRSCWHRIQRRVISFTIKRSTTSAKMKPTSVRRIGHARCPGEEFRSSRARRTLRAATHALVRRTPGRLSYGA
jgi:hypothetical protein